MITSLFIHYIMGIALCGENGKEKPMIKQYEVIKILGQGSFGKVYKCRYGKQKYAIKKLKKIPEQNSKQFIQRCLKQVKIFIKLQSQNVPKIYEYFQNQNQSAYFFVMDLCDKSLRQHLKDKNGWNPQYRLQLSLDLMKAINFLHENNTIHRDLKPQNILLKDRTIKIGDFGFAQINRGIESYISQKGTLFYRAPRTGLYDKKFDDCWSLAIIIIEIWSKKQLDFDESIQDLKDRGNKQIECKKLKDIVKEWLSDNIPTLTIKQALFKLNEGYYINLGLD